MKAVKWSILSVCVVLFLLILTIFIILKASLPDLDGKFDAPNISAPTSLARDKIGTAIIKAETEYDAAYALGYAHAQDRLFQMDLLRRQSAGELSEIVGARALGLDKKHRTHQFRKRAQSAFETLSTHEKTVLKQYSEGVNAAADAMLVKPYEYILAGGEFSAWTPVDSLLASYSMYIDLQLAQTETDYRLTVIDKLFGESMYEFFTSPSNFQSAIDGSVLETPTIKVPEAPQPSEPDDSPQNVAATPYHYDSLIEQPDYGSNNWGVSGLLTHSTSAMLSNDMHLALRVPAIWYRAQLNYKTKGKAVSVTGVSLPGTPAIIVGSNGHVAWGFTNANVDNVDWIALDNDTITEEVSEIILSPEGSETFSFEMSKYGPVREFDGQRYALKWVAHQAYAVNIRVADMAKMTNLEDALALAKTIRIPVQNMVLADSAGKIAWQLTGAMSIRKPLSRKAITEAQYDESWQQVQFSPANAINPPSERVWSANARVVSTQNLEQYGNGGYALGARQQQIASLLFEKDKFSEQDFYNIQLNNDALFLKPWHKLLNNTLSNKPQKYNEDITILNNWGSCACPDSVGYTLVRRFRSAVISQLLAPVNEQLKEYKLSTSYILREIEPAIWALLEQEPLDWLPRGTSDYSSLLLSAYDDTKKRLKERYNVTGDNLDALAWGKVNALNIKHPFSSTLGPFGKLLDMPKVAGFGDSYLPAVQATAFGASQRLIVRPGNEDKAILTIPGGQSGHFMSGYYKTGFDDYAKQANTPLLPQEIEHKIIFSPVE
jgi:penicillin amidase